MPWRSNVRPPVDGEPVSARVAGRAHDDQSIRVEDLKRRIDEISSGTVLAMYDQSIATGLAPGCPVYLHDSGEWRKALAAPSDTDIRVPAKSAASAGVILRLTSTGTGDVMLAGSYVFEEADLLAACAEDALVAGPVWLSGAGGFSSSPGPYSIQIGNLVYVGEAWRLFWRGSAAPDAYSHQHLRIPLSRRLIGDSVPDGETPAFWVEVSDDRFAGATIPAGAVLGYTIDTDEAVSSVWPPTSPDVVAVLLDGVDVTGAFVVVNSSGIWWLDSSYPSEYGRMEFLLVQHGSGSGVYVASLVSESALLRIQDAAGNAAATGRLRIVPSDPTLEAAAAENVVVLRSLNMRTGVALTGTAVSSLTAGPGVTLSGGVDLGGGARAGALTVAASNAFGVRSLPVDLVSLDRADVRATDGYLVTTFSGGLAASMRCKFRVDNVPVQMRARIQVVLCSLSGTVDLSAAAPFVQYRIVPAATAAVSALPSATDTSLPITHADELTSGTYTLAVSDAVLVSANDTVFFTFGRPTTSGTFSVLDIRVFLEAVT